jgi:DNA polymerase elongation subunit (family B)
MYKTKTIEDTELIYTILRKNFPKNHIDIEYNDNLKEYKITPTNNEYKEDPEIPLSVNIKVIYGDTDSVFVNIVFNRDNHELNRFDTFKLATICGDNLTNEIFNRRPIEMEFEKVFQPFILLTKKRYVGKKYEDMKDPLKMKEVTTAGIALTRRDYCKMVKKCYKEVIDCIMDTGNEEESINIYKKYVDRIDNYQIDFDDLIVSAVLAKNYSCSKCNQKVEWYSLKCEGKYKGTACKEVNLTREPNCKKCGTEFKCVHTFSLGHVNLATKLLQRSEEIQVNDRIQYLYVEKDGNDSGKSDLCEDPKYAVANNLKYNRMCYLEQLAKPLLGFFKVVVKDVDELIEFTNEKLVEYGGKKLKASDYKMEE